MGLEGTRVTGSTRSEVGSRADLDLPSSIAEVVVEEAEAEEVGEGGRATLLPRAAEEEATVGKAAMVRLSSSREGSSRVDRTRTAGTTRGAEEEEEGKEGTAARRRTEVTSSSRSSPRTADTLKLKEATDHHR